MDRKTPARRRVVTPIVFEQLAPRILLSGDAPAPADVPETVGPLGEWIKTDWKDIGWSSLDYVDWKFENGFNATQYWALPPGTTAGYGRPYGAEIQTRRGYDDAWYIDRLQANAQNPNFTWITFECEVAWTSRSDEVLQLVRQYAPDVQIWGGPYGGWQSTDPVGLDEYDALICFYNVGRTDRMGEDFAYILAQSLYIDRPMLMMPQPVDAGAGEPPPVTDPDAYATAIQIASYSELGVGMWYSDRLWPAPETPDKAAVVNTWASAEHTPLPETALLIPVDGDWRDNRALARVLWHAGYVCQGYSSSEGVPDGQEYRAVTWADLSAFKPAGYDTQLAWFYDIGHPQRAPDQKEIVRAMELAMAEDVRAMLVARGLDPIDEVNDAPVARDDVYEMARNGVLAPTPEDGVLANDSDTDGGALTVALLTGPAHGELSLGADGSFLYLPQLGYVGPDAFTYTADDGQGGIDTAEARITVAVDPPPSVAQVLGYWALDDAAGTHAADSGPNDYDGLLDGFADPDAAWRADSPSGDGGSLDFSGEEQVVVANAAAPLLSPAGQITVSAWIQPDALGTRTVAAKWQGWGDRRS